MAARGASQSAIEPAIRSRRLELSYHRLSHFWRGRPPLAGWPAASTFPTGAERAAGPPHPFPSSPVIDRTGARPTVGRGNRTTTTPCDSIRRCQPRAGRGHSDQCAGARGHSRRTGGRIPASADAAGRFWLATSRYRPEQGGADGVTGALRQPETQFSTAPRGHHRCRKLVVPRRAVGADQVLRIPMISHSQSQGFAGASHALPAGRLISIATSQGNTAPPRCSHANRPRCGPIRLDRPPAARMIAHQSRSRKPIRRRRSWPQNNKIEKAGVPLAWMLNKAAATASTGK
jgi:hypothetical protein